MRLIILCFILSSAVIAHEPFKHVSKASRDCDNIAKQEKYVKPEIKGFNDYFNIRFGPYTIMVPPGFDKVASSMSGSSIFISYPDESLIAITTNYLVTSKAFRGLDTNQYPDILFMKTMCDELPTTTAKQEFWEAAFIDKENVFNGSGTAVTTTGKRLTYYVSNYKAGGFIGRAHIVDRKLSDDYLILEARGFSYQDFKNIALNVTTWN